METVQYIRLIDVFALAPYLFYIANRKGISDADKHLLHMIALGTIFYNGYNFIKDL